MKIDKQPTNLEECFDILLTNVKKKDLKEWLALNEDEAISSSHHGIGQNIRNEFHLWVEDTPLVKFFNERGILHADDMSGIILHSLHRKLNNKEIKFKEQVKDYKKYWEEVLGLTRMQWINKNET